MANKTKAAREAERIILNAKLSELIYIALGDLKKCEKQPKIYTINMGAWHDPNSHCAVCFAGAVMAQTLGVPPTNNAAPRQFPTLTHAFYALNDIRAGGIGAAMSRYGSSLDASELVVNLLCKRGFIQNGRWAVVVTTYDANRKLFKQQMRSIAKAIAKHGY